MTQLSRALGTRAATLLVVSGIVGSGVFKKVAPMAESLGSPIWVLACWMLAGVVSLAGALTYAELAGMFPESGGEYAYFRKIYGKLFAFLYGWGAFTVMRSATIAAMSHIFGQSLVSLVNPSGQLPAFVVPLLATGLIIALSAVNYRGIASAAGLSRFLLYLTFAAIGVVVVLGFSADSGNWNHLTKTVPKPTNRDGIGQAGVFFGAMLGAFWGYEGWNQIAYIGEEIKEPQRNLPIALSVGTLLVIGLYLLLNTVYLYVLPIDALAQLATTPDRIAAVEVVRQAASSAGAMFVSVLILVTTTNANNASILFPARVYYAMARDGLFFRSVARIHPRYQTPATAIVFQAVWAIVLVWSGSFDQLTDMLVFASFIFYGAAGLGVILLRVRQPDVTRPYRVPGYPLVPLFFCLFCALLVGMTLINQPREALTGLGLIATGLPFFWYWQRK
jgi:basic amino acid/polyamine antiporter, APA family